MANLVCLQEFRDVAIGQIPQLVKDFYVTGADEELSMALNSSAYKRLRLLPRVLRNVENIDLSTHVQGDKIDFPVGIAPTALHKLGHPDGEKATARAAQAMKTIYCLSTSANCTIEEIAETAPNGIHWFQLYMNKDRTITESLIRRAEASGFKAIVFTVDLPVLGNRRAQNRKPFQLPSHLEYSMLTNLATTDQQANAVTVYKQSISWADVKWLRQFTKLKVILKGILTADDALIARGMGVDGVIVSNHGGRQLDSVPATIEALPAIVRAVGADMEIYVDGGISMGTDVFKALALGAKMVFIGRPALWGLIVDGENGVTRVLDILRDEFYKTMALAGCTKISEIAREMVVHESTFHRL